MPNPNSGTILRELNDRLARPPREGECRKLIFWHDAEEQFRHELEATAAGLQGGTFIEYRDGGQFALKKLLCADDTVGNYVIYCPGIRAEADNWLLSLELRGEQLSFDRDSLWAREMELEEGEGLRDVLRRFPVFFRRKEYRAGIRALGRAAIPASELPAMAACVVCGLRKPDAAGLIRALLKGGMQPADNELVQELLRCGLEDEVRLLLSRLVDFPGSELHPGQLAIHVLLSAASHIVGSEGLQGQEHRYSSLRCERCYSLVHEWQESKSDEQRERLAELAAYVEAETGLCVRMAEMPAELLVLMPFFPGADVCLLRRMMELLEQESAQVGASRADALLRLAEQRRGSLWYGKWRAHYEGLSHAVQLLRLHREHRAGFVRSSALALWKAYEEKLHLMDAHYRRFNVCLGWVKNSYVGELNDAFMQVAELVENVYSNWYLSELGEAWHVASREELAASGAIAGVDRQYFFYDNHVKGEQSRVWVIISDAMRYEVAAELRDSLAAMVTGEVKLEACQGIFPTLTNFGMAALLPRKRLQLSWERGGISLIADGMSTESPNRGEVLRAANPASLVMKVTEFLNLRASERRQRVKGMEVVYLYHDLIDAAGHHDSGVFEACAQTVAQLSNVVRILEQEQGARRVLLTADHGFLYTARPLAEADKLSQSALREQMVDMGRRHLLTREGAQPEGMQKVRLSCEAPGLEAWSPIGKVRLARQGGGTFFVHGGASLQEMMVPVLSVRLVPSKTRDYLNNRERYEMSPVGLKVISAQAIRSRSFTVELVQEDAVDARHKAVTYRACFEDEAGRDISDTHELIADRREVERRDRLFARKFTLRQDSYDKRARYYLVLRAVDAQLPPQRVEYTIDLAQPAEADDWF